MLLPFVRWLLGTPFSPKTPAVRLLPNMSESSGTPNENRARGSFASVWARLTLECFDCLTKSWKDNCAMVRPINANLKKPIEEFGPSAGNDHGDPAPLPAHTDAVLRKAPVPSRTPGSNWVTSAHSAFRNELSKKLEKSSGNGCTFSLMSAETLSHGKR